MTRKKSEITRREALRRTTMIMGGALSSSVISGVLSGCQPDTSPDWVPTAMTAEQGQAVAELAEGIIPATDTPGAKQALVERFIDKMLEGFLPDNEKSAFLKGIDQISQRAQSQFSKSLVDCTPEERDQILSHSADEAKKAGKSGDRPFFVVLKQLTLLGFFTSEPGATQVLNYDRLPGGFDGCVPLNQVGKTWAT